MFRLWGKLWKDSRMLNDTVVIQTDYRLSRTQMVFQSLEEICHTFDLSTPIWLDSNIRDFKRVSRARFNRDSFMEEIPFDYLEIQVIEE